MISFILGKWIVILIMPLSEYQTQAYVNECLNQQHGLDSPEGSAALIQANKPEVDATDIQKAQILAQIDDKKVAEQSLSSTNQKNTGLRPISPIQVTKSSNFKKS